jgi:phospholipid/cholesterol/gamma-HCH transport system permease protein
MPRTATRIDITDNARGNVTISITGRMDLENMEQVSSEIMVLIDEIRPSRLSIDCARLEYLDHAGAAVLRLIENKMVECSVPVTLEKLSHESQKILGLIDRNDLVATPLKAESGPIGFFEEMGTASMRVWRDFASLMTFLGELVVGMGRSFARPSSIRWSEVFFYMKRAGVDGLPIVGLISLLVGLIIAFMSSFQLKPLGGNVFVASLVGVAVVKELGPLMTAIIVAGRSGSAFAAEIGTMVVNDEVNALTAMGFDTTQFIVIPKVMAAIVAVPLLTLYADLFGILGGLIIGVTGLDLTIYTYIQQTQKSMHLFDITAGLVKAAAFAVLIAGIGCHRGLQVKGGAEGVGSSTTSAVVTAIFLIVVADSAFAIILHYIR